ncbi:MAG TPA: hypothetical protein VLB84_08050 [Bacteroidia bacterium]|nr:hypothetical protein [Bacteroidia bacterium]
MKKTNILLLGFMILLGITAKAQWGMGGTAAPMTALNSGDISSLDGVKAVNIVYDYSDMGVGAFRKEEDYVKKRSDEMEAKEKGSSEKFKKDWVDARKRRYEPKFEELFKKIGMKEIGMDGTNYSNSNEVTLVVHTTFIEPGTNIGVYKKPAYVDFECTFKNKEGKVLCVFYIKNAVGSQAMGFDYAVEARILESYAKGAKMLVLAIKKERKKAGKKK